jgi:pimeloyl-ACP methyl ester carboxylesterase
MSAQRIDLVMVPGLLCSPDLFAPQVSGLADVARVTIADHTRHATLQQMAASILAASPPRFALAGLSLGGYIAYEILRQAPERVTKLALLDTNARADRADQTRTRHILLGLGRTMGVRAVQSMLLKYLVHPRRLADRALTEQVLAMAEWTGLAAFERQTAAIMGRPDNREFLKSIRCPTLVLVGAEDAMTPIKVHEEIATGIAGSQLTVIPDCGHLATLEQPEAVNDALAAWLKG